MIAIAKGTCEQDGQVVEDGDIVAIANKYAALFSASHCWEQLCDEELNLQIIGDYFKECADIDLPFASTSTYTPDDAMISCMLDFAMSTPHEEFGLKTQCRMARSSSSCTTFNRNSGSGSFPSRWQACVT